MHVFSHQLKKSTEHLYREAISLAKRSQTQQKSFFFSFLWEFPFFSMMQNDYFFSLKMEWGDNEAQSCGTKGWEVETLLPRVERVRNLEVHTQLQLFIKQCSVMERSGSKWCWIWDLMRVIKASNFYLLTPLLSIHPTPHPPPPHLWATSF